MIAPPLYLDECVDHRLAAALRRRGIDVLTVANAGTLSDDDESQLLFATSTGRMLLSQNQIDFRRLHAVFRRQHRPHGGLILIPQTLPLRRLERRTLLMLDWIATFPQHASQLFRWSDLQQQLIHGYRLPGWREEDIHDSLGREPGTFELS